MPQAQPPTHLLLDVMDTLVRDPFLEDVCAFHQATVEELFSVKDKEAWFAFERGELSEAEYAASYYTDRRHLDLAGLRDIMRAGYRFLDGVEALLTELKAQQVPMFALSNYPIWSEMIEEKLQLKRFLSWDFVSWKTGVRKPDPQAYLGAAHKLGVPPQRCLFVDDREKNCAAARAVGMPALRFRDAASLRADLVERGIL